MREVPHGLVGNRSRQLHLEGLLLVLLLEDRSERIHLRADEGWSSSRDLAHPLLARSSGWRGDPPGVVIEAVLDRRPIASLAFGSSLRTAEAMRCAVDMPEHLQAFG